MGSKKEGVKVTDYIVGAGKSNMPRERIQEL